MIDVAAIQPSPVVAARGLSRFVAVRRVAVSLGLTTLATSAILMVYLMFVASGQVDPIGSTMSNYVFVDQIGWMFGASVAGLAIGGAAVLVGLLGTGLLAGRLLRLTLCVAPVSTLLVALFETNRSGPLDLSAQIHRYAAGVAFFCVPIAAVLVATCLAGRSWLARHRGWLVGSAVATAVLLTLFLTSHLGMMPEAMQQLRGLFQRILFLLQLMTLAQLLWVSVRLQNKTIMRA